MSDRPVYYPAFLDLTGKRCLVVGRGAMAEEKVEGLRSCGADVRATDGFEPRDLDGVWLVIAATNDPDLDDRIFEAATARRIFVNVADVPAKCNFILPAIVRRGPVTIAISTSGTSPALAIRLKREIAAACGKEHGRLAEILGELRSWARSELPGYAARKAFFESIVDGDPDPIELLVRGAEDELENLIESRKGS